MRRREKGKGELAWGRWPAPELGASESQVSITPLVGCSAEIKHGNRESGELAVSLLHHSLLVQRCHPLIAFRGCVERGRISAAQPSAAGQLQHKTNCDGTR